MTTAVLDRATVRRELRAMAIGWPHAALHPQGRLTRMVVEIWTPHLTADQRDAAWDELVLDLNRLADLGVGLEWRDIVPGAPPAQGYTIAAETLEQAIGEHLDVLVGGV